jgi:hypothetical protein
MSDDDFNRLVREYGFPADILKTMGEQLFDLGRLAELKGVPYGMLANWAQARVLLGREAHRLSKALRRGRAA